MSSPAAAELRCEPFPHTTTTSLIADDFADAALRWMETDAPWSLRVAGFYEQWEMHLDAETLPLSLASLVAPATINRLALTMLQPLTRAEAELIEVTAHKLVAGQTIRIHNDYLEGQESHRLLIQLNRGWTDRLGGLLMLFGSARPEDVRRIVRPLHRSGFAFTISPRSFHAVSTIQDGERFTLVYSFRARAAA
jgi:Rps23 Pro-64 3,4-dihydroxylase Tpa1-like proline 4-hydroxylase